MPCRSHDADHAALLKGAGLRVTAARVAILDVLCHAEKALDAQQVVARLAAGAPETDRVTVYRTLGALARAGIAHRVHAGDRVWRYALAGAGTGRATSGHRAHAPAPIPGAKEPARTRSRRAGAPPFPASPNTAADHPAHPHFVCDSCGHVECLEELDIVLRPARSGVSAARMRRDRRVTRQDVLLHGTCERCVTGS